MLAFVKLVIKFSISMYIMCVILFLFSALSRRVSALQMSIIIIISVVVVVAVVVRRRRSKPRKKCLKKDENHGNSVMHVKTEKVLQQSPAAECLTVPCGMFGCALRLPG